MSNEEKIKRTNYRAKRKKWISIQLVIIAIITLLTAFFGFSYHQASKDTYIGYDEFGDVNYKVFILDNDFIEDDYIEVKDENDDKSFVASLIEKVEANFLYELEMKTLNVEYEYTYSIESVLVISDKDGKPIFEKEENLKKSELLTQNSSSNLTVDEVIEVDYARYNNLAKGFIETMDLNDEQLTSSLILNMNINVDGKCDAFESDSSNEYLISLVIPLTTKTIDITMTSTVPSQESRILACNNNSNKNLLQYLTIGGLSLDVILILVLVITSIITRNVDINYELKVKRIVSNYSSYIQKINNEFDMTGYQILYVDKFKEMLEIRDTIQEPILMHENDDQTRTRFIISTNKLIYLFEVKVDNYDDLYQKVEIVEESQTVESFVSEKEEIVKDDLENHLDEEVPSYNDSEDGLESVSLNEISKLNYSFESKLILSEEPIKEFYYEIVKLAQSYKVKVSRSWKKERLYLGKNLFGVMLFKGKTLCVGLPLNPSDYTDSKYRFEDMSAYRKYQETPFLIKITSGLKVRQLIELLEKQFLDAGLSQNNNNISINKVPYKSKKALLKLGLIKQENTKIK